MKTAGKGAFLAAAFAAVFLLTWACFNPRSAEEREPYRRARHCQEIAEERYRADRFANERKGERKYGRIDHSVHYNTKLKKCIYCEVGFSRSARHAELYDLDAGRTLDANDTAIASWQQKENRDAFNRFEKHRRELFEEPAR